MNQELLNKTLANECSRRGWSYDQIGLLVELGADVNALTSNSKSPEVKPILFMIESASNQHTLLRRLMELGVKIEIEGIEAFFGRVIFKNISCYFLIELAKKYPSQMSIDFLLRMAVVAREPKLVVEFIIAGGKSKSVSIAVYNSTGLEIGTILVSKTVRRGSENRVYPNDYFEATHNLTKYHGEMNVKHIRAIHETSQKVNVSLEFLAETVRYFMINGDIQRNMNDAEIIEWLIVSFLRSGKMDIGCIWRDINEWRIGNTWNFYKMWCRLDLGGYINILHSFLGYTRKLYTFSGMITNNDFDYYVSWSDKHRIQKFDPLNYQLGRLSSQQTDRFDPLKTDLFDPLIRVLNDPYHPDHYSIVMNPTVHYPHLIPPHQKVIKTIMTFHSLNLSLFAILPKELLYEIMSWIIYVGKDSQL